MSLTPRLSKLDRNFLLNGGFDFSQEYGAGIVGCPSTPAYILDQFLASYASTYNSTPLVQRTEASPNSRTKYALRFYNMDASASTASITSSQRIESIFARELVGEACSLSAQIRSQEHQRVQVEIYTANVEDDFSAVTLAHSTSAVLTPDFNWSEIKFENFVMPSGSSRGVEVRVILDDVASTGVVFEAQIAQVKLSVGRKAQTFSYSSRDVVEELSLCQRYFEKSYDKDIALGTVTDLGAFYESSVTASMFKIIEFTTTKRVTPIIVGYNPLSGASGTWRNDTAASNPSFILGTTVSNRGFNIDMPVGGSGNSVRGHWAADARL